MPTPADAERLVADLWQLSAGRAIGLSTLAVGGRVMLGVRCRHDGVEAAAAATIAEQCDGAVESGWMVPEMLTGATEVAAVNLVPTDRHLVVESRTFGWQRSDPLRGMFLALAHAPDDLVVGVGVSLRALPDLAFLMSVGVFGAGSGARAGVARVAAALGGVGVRVRRPLRARRTIGRILDTSARRPASVERAELVALFWHPPYGAGLDLRADRRSPVAGLIGDTPQVT